MSLLCLSGRYDQLYTYATFAVILAYLGDRRRALRLPAHACRERRARTAAGAIRSCPASSSRARCSSPLNTVRQQPRETLAGLAILLLGVPVYLWMRAGANRRRTS